MDRLWPGGPRRAIEANSVCASPRKVRGNASLSSGWRAERREAELPLGGDRVRRGWAGECEASNRHVAASRRRACESWVPPKVNTAAFVMPHAKGKEDCPATLSSRYRSYIRLLRQSTTLMSLKHGNTRRECVASIRAHPIPW